VVAHHLRQVRKGEHRRQGAEGSGGSDTVAVRTQARHYLRLLRQARRKGLPAGSFDHSERFGTYGAVEGGGHDAKMGAAPDPRGQGHQTQARGRGGAFSNSSRYSSRGLGPDRITCPAIAGSEPASE
jgi:hypothetical protein